VNILYQINIGLTRPPVRVIRKLPETYKRLLDNVEIIHRRRLHLNKTSLGKKKDKIANIVGIVLEVHKSARGPCIYTYNIVPAVPQQRLLAELNSIRRLHLIRPATAVFRYMVGNDIKYFCKMLVNRKLC